MIFLYAVGVGIIVGYLRGGRISRLPSLEFRAGWLVLAALIIQLLIFPLFSKKPILPYATTALHIISYVLLFGWLLLNVRIIPLLVIAIGAIANFLAISLNGGYMPSSMTALRMAGSQAMVENLSRADTYGNVIRMGADTRLDVLGDWLYLPSWIPFATAFSIGDLLIMAGIVWLVAKGMRGHD